MTTQTPTSGLHLLSLVKDDGHLEVSLINAPVHDPKDDQVVVKVLATPINHASSRC